MEMNTNELDQSLDALGVQLEAKTYADIKMPVPTFLALKSVCEELGITVLDDIVAKTYRTLDYELSIMNKFENRLKAQKMLDAIFGNAVLKETDITGAELDEAIEDFFFRFCLQSGVYKRLLTRSALQTSDLELPAQEEVNPTSPNGFAK